MSGCVTGAGAGRGLVEALLTETLLEAASEASVAAYHQNNTITTTNNNNNNNNNDYNKKQLNNVSWATRLLLPLLGLLGLLGSNAPFAAAPIRCGACPSPGI